MILSTLDKSRKGGAYEQIPSLVLGQRWTPQLNSRNMMKVVLCVWIEPYIENDLSFCVWPVHTPTTSKEVLTLSASTSPLPYTGNKSCIVNTILSVMPKHTVYIDPCMGSAKVSLYVGLGRVAEGCYHLALAAKSYGRCVEAIKFYLALKHAGLPVIIYGAEFIKKRLLGLERVGIVPNEVMPFYCHSRFPGEDVDSFRHLNHENPDAEIALIEWQPIKPVKLKENAHE